MFMLQLCINHTVLIETLCDENDRPTGTALSASSPDEVSGVVASVTLSHRLWH